MLGHFVRARLHRRIFVWFSLAMLGTALAVGGVSGLVGRLSGAPGWRENVEGAESFLRLRFEHVWGDPMERDALADELARSFHLRVELEDAQGKPLSAFGAPGGAAWTRQPIQELGRTVGFVSLAGEGRSGPWHAALPLFIAAVVLWGFAGAISRRLAYPFFQLAQVARDLGAGRMKTRAPLRRQFGEARVLAVAVNEMADRIERQLAEQRELLAAVSHELRTPLARVRLLVELARTGQASEKLLDELDQEAIEMDRLVGELLASARVEFGALSPSLLEPAEVAARALERAGLPTTLLSAGPGLVKVKADATLLLRALANLLDNARRHGGGATSLRVDAQPGGVMFQVEDAGPGFPPGEESRAFQPFRRGQTSAPREGSSLGLGLSLVQRIAQAHGGTAFARNRPEGGACVGLVLPT